MTYFMGKKNNHIATKLYEKLCAGDAGIYDICLALYEAVKRGRHKERKRWMKVFEQLKFDAEMDKQRKSFDAEKVRELIDEIKLHSRLEGAKCESGTKQGAQDEYWYVERLTTTLLTALGIDG